MRWYARFSQYDTLGGARAHKLVRMSDPVVDTCKECGGSVYLNEKPGPRGLGSPGPRRRVLTIYCENKCVDEAIHEARAEKLGYL